MNPNIATEANTAYNQDQAQQQALNQQSGVAQSQYNSQLAGANQAQGNLTNYTNSIAGLNYGNIYGQDLSNAYSQYGATPGQLQNANLALNNTNQTLANLPQAISQIGNGYGTTAGAEANNYNNMSSQLGNTAAGQAGVVSAYNQTLSNAQNQANQQATLQLGGQNSALQGYQSAAANAATLMQQAGQVMNNIETLAQQQGSVTAAQQAQYAAAQQSYAGAQSALATAAYTQAQTVGQQQKNQLAAGSGAYTLSPNGSGGENFYYNGQPITIQQYDTGTGSKFQPNSSAPTTAAAPASNSNGSLLNTLLNQFKLS